MITWTPSLDDHTLDDQSLVHMIYHWEGATYLVAYYHVWYGLVGSILDYMPFRVATCAMQYGRCLKLCSLKGDMILQKDDMA